MTPELAQLLARYNAWQNHSLYTAADRLDDQARRADRGAFFHSIVGTLNHLLWADRIWFSRFAGTEPPSLGLSDSTDYVTGWAELQRERRTMDEDLLQWTWTLTEAWLAEDLTWFSGAAQREVTRGRALLLAHLFNHQTHHRGQVHAMLTAASAKPEATDLFLLPGLDG